ncbi:MAG: hypothetical protein JWL82_242 [Parcubacteria group bacterium]|nr:hypothetical protein [Parcubacteria group bacterium]
MKLLICVAALTALACPALAQTELTPKRSYAELTIADANRVAASPRSMEANCAWFVKAAAHPPVHRAPPANPPLDPTLRIGLTGREARIAQVNEQCIVFLETHPPTDM